MATTENFVFGNGGNTYSFSFPYLKTEDVRVELQEYDSTQPAGDQIISRSSISAFTIPAGNPTQIIFDAIGADTVYQTAPDGNVRDRSYPGDYPVRIRIYRATAADATPATFFAGSAIRAQDLNDNFDQILYIMQEKENALISIQTGGIGDNVISTSAIQDDAVDATKLRDSVSVDGNRAVTTNHIRDNAVTSAKLATNIDIAGTLDVTGAATFDSTATFGSTATFNSTATFGGDVTLNSTGALTLPDGVTGDRPGGVTGMIRFNTSLTQFEGYDGTDWRSVGAGATGAGGDAVFFENSKTVTTNYTLTTNKNAITAGPITINSDVTVIVPPGQSWVIV